MNKMIISRRGEWNNRMREIGIYLDGQKLGTIANGETKTFEVAGGPHGLKARIDWCGSREISFSVSEGETKYFQLSGFKYGRIMAPIAISIIVLHFILKNFAGINYLIWLLVPAFLITLYYITLKRNDYLVLEEGNEWKP
jgi:hypothetical protein